MVSKREGQFKIAWPRPFSSYICHQSKKEMAILKLDFEKAFDKVERQVLLKMLACKGFTTMWIGWISQILSSRTSAVLLNGTPRKFSHLQKRCEAG